MSFGRGFSLIEMLVVLFVIVLMTSLVTLNVNSGASDRVVQERLDTLVSVAEYALDEAQFSGSDFGVLFASSVSDQGESMITAHWRQRVPQGWREPRLSQEVFSAVEFPPEARLQIILDDVELVPVASDAVDPRAGTAPQWLMSASGETQVGELLVRSRDDDALLWRLEWDSLGQFEQFRGEDDEPISGYALVP